MVVVVTMGGGGGIEWGEVPSKSARENLFCDTAPLRARAA